MRKIIHQFISIKIFISLQRPNLHKHPLMQESITSSEVFFIYLFYWRNILSIKKERVEAHSCYKAKKQLLKTLREVELLRTAFCRT
jgi:hypothetical protein